MAFIDDFKDFLGDTAIWRKFASRDQFGDPTYNDDIEFTARLVQTTKLVRDQNGDQVISRAHIWLGETADTDLLEPPDVRPDDQIELSNGDTPVILSVERPQDENGLAAFTKVFFK